MLQGVLTCCKGCRGVACCMSFTHVAEVHGMLQGVYSMWYGCGDMWHVVRICAMYGLWPCHGFMVCQ